MLKSDFQYSCYESASFIGDQQQRQPPPQMPDHLKCGEVYTWLCAGELYAVECKLCGDHPLCPLSEFPEHMDIWHTEWEEMNTERTLIISNSSYNEKEIDIAVENHHDNVNNNQALSFNTEDSGLFETDTELDNTRNATSHENHLEMPEPFEQVLIEQDLNIGITTQISEDVNDEEYVKDVNEQVTAEAGQFYIENQQQEKHISALANTEQSVAGLNVVTVKEGELQYLTVSRESNGKPVKNFRNKQSHLNTRFQSKIGNFKIIKKPQSETSGSARSDIEFKKQKKYLRKLKYKTKSKQPKSSKLKAIKKTLTKIIKDIGDLKETDETESERNETSKRKAYRKLVNDKTIKTQAAIQKQNSCRKNKTEASLTESGTNVNEGNCIVNNYKQKINKKYYKQHLNKTLLKKNTNVSGKFKKYLKQKISFRKIRKNKIRNEMKTVQKLNAVDNFSQIKTRHKPAKSCKHKTPVNGNQAKLNQSIKKRYGNESPNKTETKLSKTLTENCMNLRNNKIMKKEIALKKVSICFNEFEEEPNGNEKFIIEKGTNLSKNEMKKNQNDREINATKMEPNGYKTDKYGMAKKLGGKEISENLIKQEMCSQLKQYKKPETNRNKTSILDTKFNKNVMASAENKVQNKLFAAIPCEQNTKLFVNQTGTSGIKTNGNKSHLNLKVRQQTSSDCKAQTTKCPAKEPIKTKGNETLPNENETNFYSIILSKPEENQTEGNKNQAFEKEDNTNLHKNFTQQIKSNLFHKEMSNVEATQENYTNCKNIQQFRRKSQRIRKKEEHFLKANRNRKPIKRNTVGTHRNETFIEVNENVKGITEPLVKDNKISLAGKKLELSKQINQTNELETKTSESLKDTNDTKTLINEYETNLYETVSNGSVILLNNVRKSLRNIKKNPKYFENSLRHDKHKPKAEGTKELETKYRLRNKSYNLEESLKQQKPNNTKTCHKSVEESKTRVDIENSNELLQIRKRHSSTESEALTLNGTKKQIKAQELKRDNYTNTGKLHLMATTDNLKPSPSKSELLNLNRSKDLFINHSEKIQLKRKLRSLGNPSKYKQKLSLDYKLLTTENLRSNKQKTSEYLLRVRKRCKRILFRQPSKEKVIWYFLPNAKSKSNDPKEISFSKETGQKGEDFSNLEASIKCDIATVSIQNCNTAKANFCSRSDSIANGGENSTSAEESDVQISGSIRENRKEYNIAEKLKQEDIITNNEVDDTSTETNYLRKNFRPRNIMAFEVENKTLAKEKCIRSLLDLGNTKAVYSAAKENDKQQAQHCIDSKEDNFSKKQNTKKITKQTLVTRLLSNKDQQNPNNLESGIITEQFPDIHSNSSHLNASSTASSLTEMTEPLSPLSPKTEEEHFEFYAPKEKLSRQHISHLIKLYHQHTRLWDQSHPDFCEPQLCRKSWQQITAEWNKYCTRQFSMAEVRIRIGTLCQRFVQEKERLALEGELDECAKYPYYEQMKFLEHQKSLRKRRELYEQQNEKILEIYQHFPVLWHVCFYKSRQAKKRTEAFEGISKVLKLFGLHLSSLGVQKRIRSLRKCYRLEKIRHLHAQVEQTTFDSEFRHYERMQFLDKHIDPFVCRICGKIFENLQRFREHLEAENHGSFLSEDTDTDNLLAEDELEENTEKLELFSLNDEVKFLEFSSACNQIESLQESENSTDILQRFSPFSATPTPYMENQLTNFEANPEYFPLNNVHHEPLIKSLQFEEQLIEEIMENVTINDNFNQQGLEQFINSVTNCEDLTNGNSLFEEVLSSGLLPTENSFAVEHTEEISDRTLSPMKNAESVTSVSISLENSIVSEHLNINETDQNLSNLQPAEDMDIVKNSVTAAAMVSEKTLVKELENQVTAEVIAQRPSSSNSLVVKVQCADYFVNINLNTEPLSTLHCGLLDSSNHEFYSSGDNSAAPLSDCLIHKMIELYRKFPQLWNPNHLDFSSRTLRRQAWINLTMEFNSIVGKQLSWRTLHRKLTDYAKYYKKLVTEQDNYENLANKWLFYHDFKFMDDVIAVNKELQRSVHHRDNNFKIISIYKSFPQLWNIKHPDFSKRSCKQRNFELMCNKLQEENNLQLTTERLKNRLIELRAQFRMARKQRLKCLKTQKLFSASEFEFYEALNFLEDHIDPFNCDRCKMEFKKLTEYNQHLKKEHSEKKCLILPPAEPGMENVCHICATKFTTRSNLVHHIKRHEGLRNHSCTICPKKFYASHALKVHIRSHTKECPYTCEKCGLSFVSASKLNQHVKRHLNQKDFECSYCPKAFFTAFEKDRHERRHLNIRDKACPICGKTFVAGSSYYAHLMLHSDTKRFECDKCDMKFAQYPGLFKHKKRHHT